MKRDEVQALILKKSYPGAGESDKLIETHISWVILSNQFAFKIKRPIQYSFLDFSTLGKRKYYCQKEFELNQRLTKGMYLGVVPITEKNGKIEIEGSGGLVIDYAVKMRRMDETRQMNLMLEQRLVTDEHMEQVAEKLADFHAHSDPVKAPLNLHLYWMEFADILKVRDFIGKQLGVSAYQAIKNMVKFSHDFLQANRKRMIERHEKGLTIDCHGDFHSKNILLLDEPVIFDCIEFNDHFRQIDVLNELAFFCMDLNFYKREDLEKNFLSHYLAKNQCIFNDADRRIFLYYKLYRANVKVKVNALKAMQAVASKVKEERVRLMEKYFILMESYIRLLNHVSSQNQFPSFKIVKG